MVTKKVDGMLIETIKLKWKLEDLENFIRRLEKHDLVWKCEKCGDWQIEKIDTYNEGYCDLCCEEYEGLEYLKQKDRHIDDYNFDRLNK